MENRRVAMSQNNASIVTPAASQMWALRIRSSLIVLTHHQIFLKSLLVLSPSGNEMTQSFKVIMRSGITLAAVLSSTPQSEKESQFYSSAMQLMTLVRPVVALPMC